MLFHPQYNVTSFKLKPIEKMTKETLPDGFVIDGDLNQLSDADLNSLLSKLTALKLHRDEAVKKASRELLFQEIETLKQRVVADMQTLKDLICNNGLENEVCVEIEDNELMVEYGEWKAY